MNYREILHFYLPVYSRRVFLPAVVLLVLGFVFYAHLQAGFRYHQESWASVSDEKLVFAVRLDPELDTDVLNTHLQTFTQMEEIQDATVEYPIPPLEGSPEDQEEWRELWASFLSPILYATSELEVWDYAAAQSVAQRIGSVTGVTEVAWNDEAAARLSGFRWERIYLTGLFYLFILTMSAVFACLFPIDLLTVRIDPASGQGYNRSTLARRLGRELLLPHVVVTSILFFVLFTFFHLLYPLSLPSGFVAYLGLLVKYGLITDLFVILMCLAGWWYRMKPGMTSPRQAIQLKPLDALDEVEGE